MSVMELVELNDEIREKTLRAVLKYLSTIDFHHSPPAMARQIHKLIREQSGISDPYLTEKQRDQQLAMQLLPQLEQQVLMADNKLRAAVLVAIAGNSIDHGVYHGMTVEQILTSVEQALEVPLLGDLDNFAASIAKAESILYLGDNAGEIVLDKILLNQLPLDKTTFAVRGGPIINDATYAEAQQAGITELVTVIDNGDISPGTILNNCDPAFVALFNKADMIIAKGQGNYETLSDNKANIFFLLKTKCPVIAADIGCSMGSALLYHPSA